ncbi:MAG: PepSY-associated TM helix domain-containing protein [Pseudomonadota bacterium]|nr:PepSY-associated TM helix domain-containing protein [Pseudomonadota bacterium]
MTTEVGLRYESWYRIDHPVLKDQVVVDLLQVDNHILAFTKSAAYQADIDNGPPTFTSLTLPRDLNEVPTAPLFRWLLKIHDGSIFGLPGRLFVDFLGLILIFICLSGVLIWYVPWRKRRRKPTLLSGKIFALNFRCHLKLGIVSALFIAIIALSGTLVRPPLLIAIVRLTIPASLMPGIDPDNPWADQTQRAAYLKEKKELVIASKQGLFEALSTG